MDEKQKELRSRQIIEDGERARLTDLIKKSVKKPTKEEKEREERLREEHEDHPWGSRR